MKFVTGWRSSKILVIEKELKEKRSEQRTGSRSLLGKRPARAGGVVREEIAEIQKAYSDKRRTKDRRRGERGGRVQRGRPSSPTRTAQVVAHARTAGSSACAS